MLWLQNQESLAYLQDSCVVIKSGLPSEGNDPRGAHWRRPRRPGRQRALAVGALARRGATATAPAHQPAQKTPLEELLQEPAS